MIFKIVCNLFSLFLDGYLQKQFYCKKQNNKTAHTFAELISFMNRLLIKKCLYALLIGSLILPITQQCISFYDSPKLYGYFSAAKDIPFSWNSWFEGSYQQLKGTFVNDNAGFRPDLIRIKDQVDFSLYKKMNYGGIVLGKQGYLFFGEYIDAYTGADYTGDSVIRNLLYQLKALQDTFSRLNKSLVLVHTPNKAFFYNERIPDELKLRKGPTNYESYVRIADSLGINQIDFNAWFLSMKDTCKELLMSGQGTHWTHYGSIIAGDSLLTYIGKIRKMPIDHPSWLRVERVVNPRGSDDDIERNLNLLFPIVRERFTYPILKYPSDNGRKKPKVILVGDSFVMNLLNNELPQHIFADWQYWFYFKLVTNEHTIACCGPESPLISNYDWKKEMNSTDCIVLMYNSINLGHGEKELGSGFIERAYNYYYPEKK
jgi:acetyltransferase AlgX (SGNH hydrolase-like protein)